MKQPLEQDIELLMLINPGMTRTEALRQMARGMAGQELLQRRAMAGDREAVEEFREVHRELARLLAQAQAKNEAQLVMLRSSVTEGAPA